MKNKTFLVRCEVEDQGLIRWGAENTKLEQSEVVRQAVRIGIPLLVKRMRVSSPSAGPTAEVRKRFKRPIKMAEILKATEQAH